MDLTPHRQRVAHALGALEKATERLVNALAHQPVWIAVDAATTPAEATRLACDAYITIDYGVEDAPGESAVCLGVIAASSEILKYAEAVNDAKQAFKDIAVPLYRIRLRIPTKDATQPTKAIPALRVILRSIQRSDLNLLAAYRKIPILSAPPPTVTYTRANTRAVYRKTVEEIHNMLTNTDSPAAADDRNRLLTLGPHETHLAYVKSRYQNIRANILLARLDRRGRPQISAELPLMYATGRHTEPPQVNFPVPEDEATKKPRARESQLEAKPFLKSVPVWRYAT